MSSLYIGSWSGAIPSPNCNLVSAYRDSSTGEIVIVGDLTFSTQNAPQSEDSRVFGTLQMGGRKYNFNLTGPRVYPDNVAPARQSVVATGNGTVDNISNKAIITAKFTEAFDEMVEMALFDEYGNILQNWGAASRSGNTYTKTFDVVLEALGNRTLTVKARDKCGNVGTGTATVCYIDSMAPQLQSERVYNTPWTKEKIVEFSATDGVSGDVQMAFNTETDYQYAKKDGTTYSRNYRFVGDVYEDVVGALYLKDRLNNATMEKITIGKIDNTAPTVTDILQTVAKDRRSSNLKAVVHDENSVLKSLGRVYQGSGVKSYAITRENIMPDVSRFQSSSEFTVDRNGKYYIWAMDNVGNISEPKEVLVKDLVINIIGKIEYDDQDNKYKSRSNEKIYLYRRVGNSEEEVVGYKEVPHETEAYLFETRECNDLGEFYTFRIESYELGYLATYEGNNVIDGKTKGLAISIKNTLVLPSYASSIEYIANNTYENRLLKNGQVKIRAEIRNRDTTYVGPGINNGKITLTIDKDIYLERNTLNIIYRNSQGIQFNLSDYSLIGNELILNFKDRALMADEKVTIEIIGKAVELKEYKSEIRLNGKLTSYNRELTNIDLGEILKKENRFVTDNQMPKANISLKKVDSITNEIVTDAEFTLYELIGDNYVEKEKIVDEDADGYYESNYYEWNNISEGRFKLEETKVPEYHKDNGISIEFQINILGEEDYTIQPGYEENDYKINYKFLPDGLDSEVGVIENEPYKLKAKIHNVDSQTEKEIEENAVYKVYEWNSETEEYDEYKSYLTGESVEISRQENKEYLINDWMYYTNKNEGKYRIVEETAANGYYGDYEQNKEDKKAYDINIIEVIKNKKYNKQPIENEGTIEIYNNQDRDSTLENIRVTGKLNVQLIDSDTLENEGPGMTTLEGAEYGIYAKEQIDHADGITSRYDGEDGILYKEDELVKSEKTNENGRIKFDDLECGKYYLKQIEPSFGYLPDDTEYEFQLEYKGQEVEKLEENIEVKAKVAIFDMQIQKWTNKVIITEEGKEKVKLTRIDPDEDKEEIVKVDLNNDRIENSVIKFGYKIRVTNIGELAGYATEITDILPEGLKFIPEENKNWTQVGKNIKTEELKDILIEPGESAEVELILKWENSGENTGVKENMAEITKTSNKYNVEEIDSRAPDKFVTNNVATSTVLLSMVTGGENVKIYITLAIVIASAISLGVILIKKYVIK